MAWTNLKTTYQNLTWTGNKKYRQSTNPDGSVSFTDVTSYRNTNESTFSASDINATNTAINNLMTSNITSKTNNISSTDNVLVYSNNQAYKTTFSNFSNSVNNAIKTGLTNTIKQELTDIIKQQALSTMFPVGAIYISRNNVNPSTFIGGTWKSIAQGRTLMGVGGKSSNSNNSYGNNNIYNYTINAGETGGLSAIKIGEQNIPKHYHYVAKWTGAAGDRNLNETGIMAGWALAGQSSHPYALRNADRTDNAIDYVGKTSEYGGDSSGNTVALWTLPPYYGVYMWERTA